MKRLIVNADDFGRAPGVNRGILDAHVTGIVTSTTVMINYPDAPAGIERIQADAPDLGLGLHLNLTSGPPVSAPEDIPSLVTEDGLFYDLRGWTQHFESFEAGHIEREMEAQLNRFIQLTGHPPDHLDAHHHSTYFHPVALQMMLNISEQFNIPMRNAGLDMPSEHAVRTIIEMLGDIPADFVRRLVENLKAVVAESGSPFWPTRFNKNFYQDRATLGDLLVILTNLPDNSVTELMCHPGYPDEALARSGYIHHRAAEVAHLTHAATLECIESEGITLITFGDLER